MIFPCIIHLAGNDENRKPEKIKAMMRRLDSTRPGRFCITLFIGVIFYLIDCVAQSSAHSEVPWLERGLYASGLFGYAATVLVVAVGFVFTIFGKDG
jgi:hypothetical protein